MAGIVIVGAGPGIGTSIASRFGREGMPVSLVARSEQTLRSARGALRAVGIVDISVHRADAARPQQLLRALSAAVAERAHPRFSSTTWA